MTACWCELAYMGHWGNVAFFTISFINLGTLLVAGAHGLYTYCQWI